MRNKWINISKDSYTVSVSWQMFIYVNSLIHQACPGWKENSIPSKPELSHTPSIYEPSFLHKPLVLQAGSIKINKYIWSGSLPDSTEPSKES